VIPAREQNRRIKQATAALKAAGQKVGAVEIAADGTVRVLALETVRADDKGARVGRKIEERMGNA